MRRFSYSTESWDVGYSYYPNKLGQNFKGAGLAFHDTENILTPSDIREALLHFIARANAAQGEGSELIRRPIVAIRSRDAGHTLCVIHDLRIYVPREEGYRKEVHLLNPENEEAFKITLYDAEADDAFELNLHQSYANCDALEFIMKACPCVKAQPEFGPETNCLERNVLAKMPTKFAGVFAADRSPGLDAARDLKFKSLPGGFEFTPSRHLTDDDFASYAEPAKRYSWNDEFIKDRMAHLSKKNRARKVNKIEEVCLSCRAMGSYRNRVCVVVDNPNSCTHQVTDEEIWSAIKTGSAPQEISHEKFTPEQINTLIRLAGTNVTTVGSRKVYKMGFITQRYDNVNPTYYLVPNKAPLYRARMFSSFEELRVNVVDFNTALQTVKDCKPLTQEELLLYFWFTRLCSVYIGSGPFDSGNRTLYNVTWLGSQLWVDYCTSKYSRSTLAVDMSEDYLKRVMTQTLVHVSHTPISERRNSQVHLTVLTD